MTAKASAYRSHREPIPPLGVHRDRPGRAGRIGWLTVGGFLSWWDGVELWLSGLGFVVQTILVMPVVLAIAYGAAVVLDGLLGNGIRAAQRARNDDGNH